ncbi:MAG: ParB N-terminal domain-containing protein [Tepidisphaeraceae bacterium]
MIAALTSSSRKKPRRSARAEITLPLSEVRPSSENDLLYQRINPDDPAFAELVASIAASGILEPLTITADNWIISGHRRHAAATAAGLAVIPCRRLPIRRADDPDGFLKLLAEHNLQRVKTRDERAREALVSVDKAEAYAHLKKYRQRETDHGQFRGAGVEIGERKGRAEISRAKGPMLAAVQKIIDECRDFWPLSDRQVHYRLLNDPPLIHASKLESAYANDLPSYRALTDLLTRARLVGSIPWNTIGDETRPYTSWNTWREPGVFIRQQADDFLKHYWRDLMQSQPHHVEIVAEKLTVKTIVERVAQDYTIPVTIGRGFCSIQPRYELAQRFKTSGRAHLVILLLSDFDPDGEGIAQSFARSMRDDFGIAEDRIRAVKVALTSEQVKRFKMMRGSWKRYHLRRWPMSFGNPSTRRLTCKRSSMSANRKRMTRSIWRPSGGRCFTRWERHNDPHRAHIAGTSA